MTDPVRIGLIGAGDIARLHVQGYRSNPDTVRFAAVADPVRENALRRRGDDPGVAVFDDYRTMMSEADLDAVDICLPHHLHAEAIIAAADAGLHVLCEKPLCLTMSEAAAIVEAVERSGITVMCAHNQLFLPAIAEAKRLIDDHKLGTVYEVRSNESFFNEFTPENMGWRAHASTAGGGELIDSGYHPVYLLQHLAGSTPVEVTAMLSRHRLQFMDGEDSAEVLVRYENGTVGIVTTSWAYQSAPGTPKMSVVGDAGSLAISADGSSVTYRQRGGQPETTTFERVDDIAAEIGHFADCIRTGARPLHTYVEGIDVLGVILAAYESDRTRAFAPVQRARSTSSV